MEFLEYVVADAKLKGRTQSLTPSVYNTLLELYLQEGSRVKHMRQSFVVTGAGLSGGYRTAYVSSNFLAQTGYERDEVIDQEFTTFAVEDDEVCSSGGSSSFGGSRRTTSPSGKAPEK